MKELSVEQKAKAYDEALKVLHKYDGAHIMFTQDLKEEMFPELKEESEDEKIRRAIIDDIQCMHREYSLFKDFSKEAILAWLEKQSKASKVEQAMREVEEKAKAFTESHKGETSEEILAQIRGEQKPWNEEDDYNLQCCIAKIQYDIDNGRIGRNRELLTWLKSLRPQNKWKPSDEQMDALRYVANFDYGGHKATLVSLYEQLKKLKGE